MSARLDELRAMLAARTDANGQPVKGYAKNVAAIRAEIARLEQRLGVVS